MTLATALPRLLHIQSITNSCRIHVQNTSRICSLLPEVCCYHLSPGHCDLSPACLFLFLTTCISYLLLWNRWLQMWQLKTHNDQGVGWSCRHPMAQTVEDPLPSSLTWLLVGLRALWAAGWRQVLCHVHSSLRQPTTWQLTSFRANEQKREREPKTHITVCL